MNKAMLLGLGTMSMLACAQALADPQYDSRHNDRGERDTFRCESDKGRSVRCNVKGAGDVRFVRQLSDARCVEGQTWGRDRGFVWVAAGCRAEFETRDYGSGNSGSTFRCESSDNRYRQCNSDSRGRARLVRQLSDTQCIEGRTWGSNRAGVWVDRGCRAEFSTGGWGSGGNWGNRPGNGNDHAQTIRCESSDERTRRCAASIRSGVRLLRQLSDTRCVQGQNWGWDRSGVWVSRGCRAEFSVR